MKMNTYEMHVLDDMIPVFYNFTGIDVLMGSHYDRYDFEYTNFAQESIPDSIFDIPKAVGECRDYPGPGVSHTVLNPMAEFIGDEYSDAMGKDSDVEFEDFKKVTSISIKIIELLALFPRFD